MEHIIQGQLLERRVSVGLVGTGGTGSQVLTGLARLDWAMKALGHPGGLKVTAYDPDMVSEANVGRQLFSPADVGLSKALVLVHRVNAFFGLSWQAVSERARNLDQHDIVIGCVDSRGSRQEIWKEIGNSYGRIAYWLDIGNRAADGQVILGEAPISRKYWADRLPTVAELLPEIIDTGIADDDDGPSCSLAEALEKQELFVNQAMATFALDLLSKLFRHGRLSHHGIFVNLASGKTTPLPVCPEGWARFGFRNLPPEPEEGKGRKKPRKRRAA